MKLTRRQALLSSGAVLAGAALARKTAVAQSGPNGEHSGHKGAGAPTPPISQTGKYTNPKANEWYARTVDPDDDYPPGEPIKDYTPVVVPNGASLPFKIVDGVKVVHLIAEPVDHEFAPGLKAHCWGYNGRTPGPVIEAVEGDRIRVYVTNKLPVPTSVHWHAVILPCNMDGVSGLVQRPIEPGETFKYEFKATQHGTFMYHSHKDTMTQEGMGLVGMIVIHPRRPRRPRPDRDFVLLLHEWDIKPGTYRTDTTVFSGFNTLTFNAKVFPATEPLVTKTNDRVRIRIGNLSAMNHHPIHLHGHSFRVTETDGGEIPEAALWPESTVLVAVGQTRTVEFISDNPGDWAVHCHMTHHLMNQMGHELPNMVGVNPKPFDRQVANLLPGYMTMGTGGMIDMGEHAQHADLPENSIPMLGTQGPYSYIGMGGMVTVLKVRDGLKSYDDPGWYRPPKDTVARPATVAELKRDGVKL